MRTSLRQGSCAAGENYDCSLFTSHHIFIISMNTWVSCFQKTAFSLPLEVNANLSSLSRDPTGILWFSRHGGLQVSETCLDPRQPEPSDFQNTNGARYQPLNSVDLIKDCLYQHRSNPPKYRPFFRLPNQYYEVPVLPTTMLLLPNWKRFRLW